MRSRIVPSLLFLLAAVPSITFAASPVVGPATAPAPSPVADAAMNGDLSGVRALIAKKADVNAPQPDGSTALHWAVHLSNHDMVDALLKAGADPKTATRLGATPLYLASITGDPVSIKKLLAAGADPNEKILEHGESSLMFAARSGNLDSVRILLDAGAKVDVSDQLHSTTALMWAAEQNHADIVKLLLDHKAPADARTKVTAGVVRPARKPAKAAAAAAAAADGQEEEEAPAQALPASANSTGGVTALMLAVRENAVEAATALLDGGAPINETSGNGSTALLVATQNGSARMAHLLIERGADVNLANGKGWNPLYLAIKARTMEKGTMPNPEVDENGLMEDIKMMVDKGANVNARLKADTEIHNGIAATWLREAGATPFLRASLCGDLEVMKLLLAHGADPKISTTDGTTTLMALSGVGYAEGFMHDFGTPEESLEAMKLLIDAGINVNAKNTDDVTALHGAAHKNFVAGIQMLVLHGADLTARSHRASPFERVGNPGNTPLDWATGVQIGMQSSIYHPDSVNMVTKLMKERGIEVKGLSSTKGGLAVAR